MSDRAIEVLAGMYESGRPELWRSLMVLRETAEDPPVEVNAAIVKEASDFYDRVWSSLEALPGLGTKKTRELQREIEELRSKRELLSSRSELPNVAAVDVEALRARVDADRERLHRLVRGAEALFTAMRRPDLAELLAQPGS